MRLATKLILAFVLLSVVPLTWITVYTYRSSITVFRKAVEAESSTLTEEMGGRMAAMQRDLAYRVERLSSFPFPQLMTSSDAKVDSKSNPYMARLLAEIGDVAPLVDTIEFNAQAASPAKPPTAGRVPTPPLPHPADPPQPQHLVIQLSSETPAPPANNVSVPSEAPEAFVMRMRPSRPGPPPKNAPMGDAERQKIEAQIRQMREFQVVLEKMGTTFEAGKAGELRAAEDMKKMAAGIRVGLGQKPTGQVPGMQRSNPLASNFGSEVHADGNTIGTVRARISSRQMFRNVLSGGRHRQGEIPFVIDSVSKLHTVTAEDEKKLQTLGLPAASTGSGKQAASPAIKDWVLVTRKDEEANVTFGIARPISQPLREIRNTAVRNLGFGLGMVGLALIGIIPLSKHMTRNLAELSEGAKQLAQGNLNARVPVRSRDEIGRLAESFNRMAHDLTENQKHLVEQERLRKELEMSRRIQEELLPKHPLHAGVVEVKGVSIPAREVGGDFFNYFPLPQGEVAILVGDVSGKGVAAALLMANLQATLQARLPLESDLAELARRLDHEIFANTPPEVYLTLFMSVLNPGKNQLRYVSAGHHTQFALRLNGGIERLESTGRPLGLLPGGPYEERRIDLAAGDSLFLYTDGLTEAENAEGREFGSEQLESILLDARKSSINEILVLVEEENRKHRGNIEAADDATMLVLKIGAAAPKEVPAAKEVASGTREP